MKPPARLLALFNVRPAESRLVAMVLGLALSLNAAGVLTRTAAYALFLAAFSGDDLPYTYIGLSVAGPLVTLAYLRLSNRVSLSTATRTGVGLLLFLLLACRLALQSPPLRGAAVFALPVISGVFVGLATTIYWNLLGRLFTLQQAKRLFNLLNSAEQAAVLVGGLLVPVLVGWVGTANLLLVGAVSLAASWLVLSAIGRRYRDQLAIDDEPGEPTASRTSIPRSGYVLLLFTLFAVYMIGAYVVNNLFYVQAQAQFTDSDALAGFLGLFLALTGGLSLVLQLTVTARLLGRYGVSFFLLLTPLAVLLFSAPFAVLSARAAPALLLFALAALAHFCRIVFDAADTAALNLLYQPLPALARTRVQTLIDGILYPLSIGAAGVLLLLLINVAGLSQTQLAFVLLAILALWLALAYALGQAYPLQVQQALRKRLFSEGDALLLEPESTAEIERLLRDPSPGTALYALNLLQEAEAGRIPVYLDQLLSHPAALVRVESATQIERLALGELLPSVAACLAKEPNVQARAALQRTLARLGDDATARALWAGLAAHEAVVQRETLVGLLSRADGRGHDDAAHQLGVWAMSADATLRADAAYALGAIGERAGLTLWARLLRDHTPAVRHAALGAAGRCGEAALWPLVLDRLDTPQDAGAAADVFVAIGQPAVAFLIDALEAAPPAHRGRRVRLARTLGRIGGEVAAAGLYRQLPHPDFDTHAQLLQSLCRCGFRLPSSRLEAEIAPDVVRAVWLLTAWADVLRVLPPADLASQLLATALEQALAVQRRNIFCWLSFVYEPRLMRQIQFNLDLTPGGRTEREQIAYAGEVIELHVAAPVRDWIKPIVSTEAPETRLKAVAARFRQTRLAGPARLASLIAGVETWLPPWVCACAAFVAGGAATPDLDQALRAASQAADPLIVETANHVLRHMMGQPPATTATGDNPMLTTIEKTILLKSVEFFAGTPDSVLAQVAGLMEEVSVAAGQVIIARGEAGDSMYIVAEGLLRVHMDEVTLAWMLETDVVGELALLDGAPRSATVTAAKEGVLLRLGREAYHELLEDHADIGRRTLQLMAQRLRLANAQLSALNARPLAE